MVARLLSEVTDHRVISLNFQIQMASVLISTSIPLSPHLSSLLCHSLPTSISSFLPLPFYICIPPYLQPFHHSLTPLSLRLTQLPLYCLLLHLPSLPPYHLPSILSTPPSLSLSLPSLFTSYLIVVCKIECPHIT